MALDTVILSRAQFGFTIGFHILFPTLNIGLAIFIAIMEGLWLKTKNPEYQQICKFWTKIFALTFGMGVVSGVVLSYELGTNFGQFVNAIGGILGPLFAYEVLSAFFLEAGFLGVMLFGWNKVGPKLHYAATLLVALGTAISAFWIMSANSWMQTPTGYEVVNGKYIATNWFDAVLNPSFLPRFTHMIFASLVTTCFVVAGVSAWHLFKQQHIATAKRTFSFALSAALILVPAQVMIGDRVGLAIHQSQPLKTAAIEGLWETRHGAPLVLVGIPDVKNERNLYSLEIPYGASWINTHHFDGELIGLKSVPPNERPHVSAVFYSFRVMVGIGFLFLAIALYAFWLKRRGKLFTKPWFYRICIAVAPLGFVSSVTGWLTAEMGRQPWIIYGLMRTSEGASLVPASNVLISLIAFIVVYGFVFSFYIFYLFKLIAKGPEIPLTSDVEEPFSAFQYMTKSSD